jgi:fibrillarin-like pre-rRNA processing protein
MSKDFSSFHKENRSGRKSRTSKNNNNNSVKKNQGFVKSNYSSSKNKSSQKVAFRKVEQGFNPVEKFPRVFSERKGKNTKYFVESRTGKTYFEEFTIKKNGKVYREVNPERSKLFASIALGISQIGFKEDSKVLYLGASHGYTVSFLADMVREGEIYALDFAPRVLRDLVFLCEDYPNMAPLMADANHPEEYKDEVPLVDVVFMDISQRNQTEIFLKNCDMFLKKGGFGLLALKARSVDVTKKPREIFKIVREELEAKPNYTIVDYKELSPLEQDHAMFVVKKR